MYQISFSAKVILCAVIVQAIVGPEISRAEPILLAHLYHSGGWVDEEAAQPFRFSFTAYLGPGDPAELVTSPTITDVGQTFAADPATLAKFDTILTDSMRGHSLIVHLDNKSHFMRKSMSSSTGRSWERSHRHIRQTILQSS